MKTLNQTVDEVAYVVTSPWMALAARFVVLAADRWMAC